MLQASSCTVAMKAIPYAEIMKMKATVPARAPVSLRLGYGTESDQASKSCTGKVLYYYVYFWRGNQR